MLAETLEHKGAPLALGPSTTRTHRNAATTKRCGHSRVRYTEMVANPSKGSPSGVQRGSLPYLFICEALTTDDDALTAKHLGDPGLRDFVLGADLLGGLAGFVAMRDVNVVAEGQEAFCSRRLAVLI